MLPVTKKVILTIITFLFLFLPISVSAALSDYPSFPDGFEGKYYFIYDYQGSKRLVFSDVEWLRDGSAGIYQLDSDSIRYELINGEWVYKDTIVKESSYFNSNGFEMMGQVPSSSSDDGDPVPGETPDTGQNSLNTPILIMILGLLLFHATLGRRVL